VVETCQVLQMTQRKRFAGWITNTPAKQNFNTNTMTDYNLHQKKFKPICTDILSAADDQRYAYFNRQSDSSNSHGHRRYLPMLAREHTRLSSNEPFNPHLFTKSGDIGIIQSAFCSDDIEAAFSGTYFEALANALKHELQNAKKLCAVFPSLDRIFRPLKYNPQGGTATWVYTNEDYILFQKWLEYVLGTRAADVLFAVIDNNPPNIVRSNSIKSGHVTAGKCGGRPKAISPKEEALRLARDAHWNAGQIRRYLLSQHKIKVSVEAIQKWLKKTGLQSLPGRPKKEEKNA